MAKQEVMFSVIIPTFNEGKNIRAVLQAVEQVEAPAAVEVIVVDNGSSDDTVAIAKESGAVVIENNSGVRKTIARLRNEGASAASGEILAFLDGDMLVPVDWLAKSANHFQVPEHKGAVGFAETVPEGAGWVAQTWGLRDKYNRRQMVDVDFLPGRNLLVCREVFDAVGGFDEGLTTNEDKEFTYRLVQMGYRAIYQPATTAIHLGYEKDLVEFVKKEFWRQSTTLPFARRWGFALRTLRNPLLSFGHLFCLVGWVVLLLSGSYFIAFLLLLFWLLPAAVIAWRGQYAEAPSAYPWRLFGLTLLRWNVAGVALLWQLTAGEPFRGR